jgi:hypothetical protein
MKITDFTENYRIYKAYKDYKDYCFYREFTDNLQNLQKMLWNIGWLWKKGSFAIFFMSTSLSVCLPILIKNINYKETGTCFKGAL